LFIASGLVTTNRKIQHLVHYLQAFVWVLMW